MPKSSLQLSSVIFITLLCSTNPTRYRRGIEPFLKNNNNFFMRINIRNDLFASSVLIAYASGFRMNWATAPILQGKSSSIRKQIHDFIKIIMERNGLDGQACIKKAACEIALRNPIDTVDHLVDLLLRKEDEEATCKAIDNEIAEEKFNCTFPLMGLTTYLLEQAFLVE